MEEGGHRTGKGCQRGRGSFGQEAECPHGNRPGDGFGAWEGGHPRRAGSKTFGAGGGSRRDAKNWLKRHGINS